MMRIDVLTLFPEMVEPVVAASMNVRNPARIANTPRPCHQTRGTPGGAATNMGRGMGGGGPMAGGRSGLGARSRDRPHALQNAAPSRFPVPQEAGS